MVLKKRDMLHSNSFLCCFLYVYALSFSTLLAQIAITTNDVEKLSKSLMVLKSHAECRWPDLEVDVDDRNL